MLSTKVIEFCKEKGWWSDNFSQQYADVLLDLEIPLGSEFGQFYLHVENGPTFLSRNMEIYQICWFVIYSDYDLDINRTHNGLKLPIEYIPLDSFQGEGGFLYNRKTGEVLDIQLGPKLIAFQKGELQPQWKDFSSFLEWYFEIA